MGPTTIDLFTLTVGGGTFLGEDCFGGMLINLRLYSVGGKLTALVHWVDFMRSTADDTAG